MKIGVLSDSHGNVENLKNAAFWLVEEEKVDLLIHLGDDSEDAKVLQTLDVRLIVVPGVFEPIYQDPKVTNRIIEKIGEEKILISHTEEVHKNDPPSHVKELLNPLEIIEKREVQIALFGHSHIPKIEEKEGVLILNPGHLKDWDEKKGYLPSFGLIDLKRRLARIINLQAKVPIIEKKF